VGVGEAVAGEQHALGVVEGPLGGGKVQDHGLEDDDRAAAEIERVPGVQGAQAVGMLGEEEVVVAHVAAHLDLGMAPQHPVDAGGVRGLLVGREQVAERRAARRQQPLQLGLDHRQVLRVAGLDQRRVALAADQVDGVVVVQDPAAPGLLHALAEPEDPRGDLARQRVVGDVDAARRHRTTSRPTGA
jgi:hypothetical protein